MDRLAERLELSGEHGAVLLLISRSAELRRWVEERLVEALNGALELVRLEVSGSGEREHIPAAIERLEQARAGERQRLYVIEGLSSILAREPDDARSDELQALNLRREIFPDRGLRVVFWLDDAGDLESIRREAADFWAFRGEVIQFISLVDLLEADDTSLHGETSGATFARLAARGRRWREASVLASSRTEEGWRAQTSMFESGRALALDLLRLGEGDAATEVVRTTLIQRARFDRKLAESSWRHVELLGVLGMARSTLRRDDEARAAWQLALELREPIDREAAIPFLETQARIAAENLGNVDVGLALARRAEELSSFNGHRPPDISALSAQAEILEQIGRIEDATAKRHEALSPSIDCRDIEIAEQYQALARLQLTLGRFHKSLFFARCALEHSRLEGASDWKSSSGAV